MIHRQARQSISHAVVVAMAAQFTLGSLAQAPREPTRDEMLVAMKRATTFMTERVAYNGGYVWNYLPDLSRRWGEMAARETMIWIQPPSTPTMGYWRGPFGYGSHPYKGDGSKAVAPGNYRTTHVGDDSDTSPYPDSTLTGISLDAFIRNMSVLIRAIDPQR